MASWQTIRTITRRSSRMLKVNLGECQQVSPCLKLRSQTAKNEFENPEHYSLGLAINQPPAGFRRRPSKTWIKVKNPKAPAATRAREAAQNSKEPQHNI